MADYKGPTNSRGDTLSNDDWSQKWNLGPAMWAEMISNWLTAGGPPKPLDVSKLYGDQQVNSGVQARAAAGQGIAGLFGFGKTIGSMAPMTSGVPYSVTPAPKVGLNPLFTGFTAPKPGGR